jgi:poly [ADP-ribose] polymerase
VTPRPENVVNERHLLKVEPNANNNKIYDMYDTGDGKFTVHFGRVGADVQVKIYPISDWDKKLREKLGPRKGYKDVTHLRVESASSMRFADISDNLVAQLVADLQRFANNLIQATYLVGAGSVTLAMVAEAQRLIDEITYYTDNGHSLNADRWVGQINDILIKLYTAIPRKMKNVRDHMIEVRDNDVLRRMIVQEQDNLDAMESQVKATLAEQDNKDDKITLLDAIGIQIFKIKPEDAEYIKKKMGDDSSKFRKAFEVVNLKTKKRFENWLQSAQNKRVSDFWHGSRNQNWWSLMQQGLLLRPTNAVITGKMFGYGLYFADRARKSIGYTSLSGSYWAGGSDSRAYLAMFAVHTGNAYKVQRHYSALTSYNYNKLKSHGEYDCLFAEGGYDLRNNEFIIYNEAQADIKFLVEIGN